MCKWGTNFKDEIDVRNEGGQGCKSLAKEVLVEREIEGYSK